MSRRHRRALIETFEARILYSADPGPAGLAAAVLSTSLHADDGATTVQQQGVELVFVDARVPDVQQLLDDLSAQRQSGLPFEVVVVGGDQDGIAVIGATLVGRSDVSAVHVIGHGSAGVAQLGATELDADSLLQRAGEIAAWGDALTADADLLLYGCDIASTDTGKAFVDQLAQLTGADVAASDDLTGAAALGGDWLLEYRTGAIEAGPPITSAEQLNWQGVLATYTVTNTNDSGVGSLRTAITSANANAGTDTINFSITGTGIHTISLSSALPVLTGTVIIDATTDDSFAANGSRPAIVLRGNGSISYGLDLYGGTDGSTIRGLIIQNFTSSGINLGGSSGNTIVGNWLGLDSTGTAAAANGGGLSLYNSNNNIIGGSTAADRNVISGNTNSGIGITTDNSTSTGNQIRGNYIGTNAAGTAAVGNGAQGIWLDAANNTIGGTSAGQGNVISGTYNWGMGIQLGSNASGTVIVGNTVGLNAAGTAALANVGSGIYVESANNTIGGTTAASRNIVSGNSGTGIVLTGTTATGNTVSGNYIGLNAAGTAAIANVQNGILIGVGASGNTIGGATAGARNVVSGNTQYGVNITGEGGTIPDNNIVQGNYIGTDAAGTTALSNGGFGVVVDFLATNTSILSNVISGNTNTSWSASRGGIYLSATGVTIQGNKIGVDATGTVLMGNGGGSSTAGIYEAGASSNVLIGGTTAGQGNIIAGNTGAGIVVNANPGGIRILQNSIYSNTGLGIDLGNDGVTANDLGDGDSGANDLQNMPVLSSAVPAATQITISGTLNSTASSYFRVEFFSSSSLDSSGYGEGQTYLGFVNVTTNSSGNASFSPTLTASVAAGSYVTATATRSNSSFTTYTDTSEFSAGVIANNAPVLADTALSLTVAEDAGVPSGAVGSLVSTFTGGISDADSGAVSGIALVASNQTNGTWYYTTNGGSSWSTVGSVSSSASLLLANNANTRLYFAPVANYNGSSTSALTIRAWDQTSGTAGTKVSTSTNGGSSAFSSATDVIDVTVTPVNDPPVITSGATANVAENTTTVMTVTSTDIDGGTPVYSISGGVDAAKFSINSSTGVLSFVTAPDYEVPTDSGADNVYNVTVQVSDGAGGTDSKAIAVTVTAVNDNAPVITSSATANVAENTTAVMTVTATDADLPAQTLTYSIVAGSDAAKFTINSSTGVLSFITAPDYENPQDVGTDNVYNVTVQASDGTFVGNKAIAVTVTPVNDNTPVITSAATANVAENTTTVMTVTATDADLPAQTLTYSISGGVDAAKFSINSSTGVLSFVTAPNYEAPTDSGADNVYNVTVRASDGTLSSTKAIAVTVTPVNDNAPVITSSGTANVAENTTTVMTVTATDADLPAQTLTYSIVAGSDAAKFTINSSTGVLSFITAPDYENPQDVGTDNVYNVTVQASDGTFVNSKAIAVTVTDVSSALIVTTTADTNDTGLGSSFTAEQLNANKGTDGKISLREAMIAANTTAGIDTISFNIADALVSGSHTIKPTTALPTLTGAVIIDGTTEPDYVVGRPVIEIDGSLTGSGVNGLVLGAGAGGSTIRGLAINSFGNGYALYAMSGADGNLIEGNIIGLDADGTTAVAVKNNFGLYIASAGNTIGGTTAAARNVLSNNINAGVALYGSNNIVIGNYMGTDATGTLARGNNHDGVDIFGGTNNRVGGTTAAERNIISGNSRNGIELGGSIAGTLIQGNYIGTDVTGTQSLGNSLGAVWVGASATGVMIGGTAAGAGNLIVNNPYGGVYTDTSTVSVSLLGNTYYNNTNLAIDLNNDGVTANDAGDADTGPNSLQNFPVITSVRTSGTEVQLFGSLSSNPTTYYRIEIYANTVPDSSGYGEGQRYIGEIDVYTDGSGYASFIGTFFVPVAAGEYVTATATKSDYTLSNFTNTSEFGPNVVAVANQAPAVTTTGSALAYTENTTTAVDNGLTVSDPDSIKLTGATVTISSGFVSGQDRLVFTNIGIITGVWNDETGVLTLSGSNSAAGYQAALRSVTYLNTSDTPTTASRTVTFAVTDDFGAVGSASRTVSVSAVNDAPSFDAADFSIVTTPGSAADRGYATTIQPDGRILVAGYSSNGSDLDFLLMRFNADGTLDTSFGGGDGIVTTAVGTGDDEAHAVAVQSDGKILVAGFTQNGSHRDFALVRYNTDGSLDTSFGGGDGIVTTDVGSSTWDEAWSMVLQSDGRIVLGGASANDFAVVRYLTDGSLDTSFSGDGKQTVDIGSNADAGYGLALQADGKLVQAGTALVAGNQDFVVVRYNTDGSLDTSFSGDGIVTTAVGSSFDIARAVTVQSDGKIVVGGYYSNGSNNDFAVVRYTTAGALDTSFSGDGIATVDFAGGHDAVWSVAMQPDGKIVAVGGASSSDLAVARFSSDGSLDTSFSGDGKFSTRVGNSSFLYSTAIGADGRIVTAGYSNNTNDDVLTVRLTSDGQLDTRANPSGTSLGGATAYTENAAAVVIDSSVRVFDAELYAADNYAGATLTLVRNGGANSQDVFSAAGNLGALTPGGNLTLSGVTVGTVTTNAGGTLLLTFNSAATQARVNEVMSSIAYANTSDAPPASVTLNWTFSDGNSGSQGSGGALTCVGSSTINITAVNDPPAITSAATANVAENTAAVMTVTSTDVDGGTPIYSILGGVDAAKFTINSSTGALSFISAPDYEALTDSGADNVYNVTVQVSDGAGGTTSQAIAVTVTPVNDNTPVITSSATADVAENTTAVMTVTATDADLPAQTLTYSIVGGADAAKFTINSSSGALSFVTAPDYEAPTDSGADNVYNVTVQASDGSLSSTKAIAVTVTPVNDNTPVITSSATANVAENTTAVMTVTATDADLPVQTLTYSIVGGADAAKFTINSSSGALSFITAPDYEAPTDSGADNVYDVTVQASDGSLSSTKAIAVTVTPVNDNTPIITSSATANVAENTTAVMTVTATDADLPAQTLTYSIVGGADAAKFTINSSSGALSFVTAPDYEAPTDSGADNVYNVTVQASDGSLSSTKAIAVTVTPVNDNTPVITSSATANVAENTTAVMTVTATDADLPAQTLTYSIVGGADAAKFTINSSSGALSFVTAPDYEAPTDSGADNVYNVTVQASDGSLSSTKAIAVTVTPVNDNTPVITSSATANVAENTTAVMTVTATDADLPAQTLTYSIVGGADAAKFTINSSSGALSFVTAPDYEAPTDSGADNVYNVTVQASDGSLSSTKAIAVTVTSVNDNTPVITSSATANVAENTTTVMTVTATDADLPAQTLTYSIVGGADAAKFTINSSSGALSFVTASDYEAPTDSGADNIYDVTVQASDGSLSSTQAIAVTVTAVNDNTPVITSSATANVAENTTAVMTVTATDADLPAQTLTYSIVGGADAAKFTINSSSGALSFVTAPDYEAPTDSGADNVYNVTVQASDGSLSSTKAIAVTVTSVNDNTPVITSSATANVAENTTAVMTVTATDADLPAQTLTYSIVGGADAAKFQIDSSSGALSFVTAPDYENPTDAGTDNIYDVTVQASDGSLSSTQAIAVTVTAVNDNTPVITSGATANVAENSTAVMTVTATDADLPAQTLTYSIVGGADAAKFTINSSSGSLSFITAPDYEAPTDVGADNVYDVTVQASDGSLSSTQAIAVTVTPVNDNTPVITSSATANVAENTTTVMTVTATDADLPPQTLTYSIVGGADAAKFTINSSSGALSFVTAPDYEAPTDSGADNVYNVTVQASDGSLSSTKAIAVTVTSVNDNTPIITSSATANVAENTTTVMTVTATDADLPAQTLTYSIVGGADAAKFTINSSSGALSFVTASDYEAPTDSGADNIYDVTVQASDGSLSSTQAIAVTVTAVNDNTPVITSSATANVAENTTTVMTVTATDADLPAQTLTYSIVGGADAAKFTINSSSGALSFVTASDYEAPTDSGADNIYDVTVQASDGSLSSTQAIAVTVTAVNDNTPVITSSATANVAENTTAVMTVTATDADLPAQTLTYSIVGGADAAKFTINSSSGALSFVTAPDYENPTDAGTDNIYNVTVQASDGSLSSTKAITVTVTPVNDNTPVITSSATANVAENTTTVMTVSATDADLPAQTLTYSIVGGADAAKFTINSSSGALSFVTAPDYEAPTDSGADNVYNVTVQASDGSLSSTKAIAVTVTPVNDNTPVITSSATANVAENTTAVMTVTATDADLPAQTLTYSIVGGADAAKFTINSSSGALSFVTAPDYENPTDAGTDNIYNVTVQASDGSLSSTKASTVTVTPVNDNTPVITSSATANVAENTTTVMTVSATDADLPAQTLTYSIVGGADAAKFTINSSSGALSFVTAPDYEAPTDSGADNVYNVTVQASDGSLSSTKAIAVTVTPVNDNTPVITSSATANVAENTTAVMTVTATDADLPAQTLTYSIVGGADAAKFTINSSSGALSFVTAPDYEAPTDSGADNVYNVTVQASDGSLSSTQAIAVTVTPVNDNTPVITSSVTANVAENTTAVMTVTATDADLPAQTLTYSIVGGADAAKFTINSSSGALSFVTAPDYEAPTDSGADNVYNVTVQASDGSLSSTQAIAVTVTAVNDNTPVITSGATVDVAENTTAVMTVTATDADLPAQTLTYLIVGGADAAKFQIDANTGALSFITAPDYEAPTDSGSDNIYNVTVQASDGSLSSTKAIAVTVTPVNDNTPVITSSATANVAENTTAVMTVTATDADLPAQTLTYSIVGGADAAKFTINSSSGALSFVTAPDYEAPTDVGADNVYNVTVQASDGSLSSTQAIAVTVTPVNDNTPVITSSATANVAENTTAVMTVTATDADLPAQTLTYSIVGGADAAKFTINSSSGALSFVTAPDYEAPTDVGADNVYDVTVQASDGSLSSTQAIAVTVTAVNDNTPVITSSATANVAENTTAVMTVTATDADLPPQTLTYSIVGGADAAKFQIDSNTGVLSFVTAPDYEAPTDSGADNVYNVTVQASDGSLSSTQAIAVTVTAVNDNTPVITSSATANVAENTTTVMTVTATDADLPAQTLTYSIVGGADAAKFTINSSSGALSFVTAPDYEAPTDSGADNVYDVTVQASDGSLSSTKAIAVTVTDVSSALIVTTTADTNDTGLGSSFTAEQLNANMGADGKISLREALIAANTTAGADTISFNIAGGGPHTIVVTSALPTITDAVTINGTTEPDYAGTPVVVLDGNAAVSEGLDIEASNTTVRGLVINNFTGRGILVTGGAANVLIAGNYIGTDASGVVARGNGSWGIDLVTAGSGTVIGGTTAADRNVIVSNLGQGGIAVNGTQGATILGNYVGVGADGTTALGNGTGILLLSDTTGTQIGGVAAGAGNIIANNAGEGVILWTAASHAAILGNTFYNNTGQAIDLNWNGTVEANDVGDADTGPNQLQNFPVISSAVTNETTQIVIAGTLNSEASSYYRIEFYANPVADSNGYGEGRTYLGSANVTTDVSGNVSFNVALSAVVAAGESISATATRSDASFSSFTYTSEFAANVTAQPANSAPSGVDSSVNVTEDTTYTFALSDFPYTDANSNALLRVWIDTLPAAGTLRLNGSTFAAGTGILASEISAGHLTYQPLADSNTSISLTFRVQDDGGTVNGGQDTDASANTLTINITPVNDPPAITSGATANVAENTTTVMTVTSSDIDGGTPVYSISGGVDAAKFTINSSTGVLSFITAPDYEAPTDSGADNVYNVTVQVSDGAGGTDSTAIAVTVTAVNDNTPVITSAATANVLENTTTVMTVTATDADLPPQTLTYSIVGGADAAKFTINSSSGALSFVTAPDYEAPTDSGADNVYNVTVQASDGSLSSTKAIAVTVTPVNDNTPVITSSTTANVAENTTAVMTVTATDADLPAQTLTYSIVGGADAAKFTINSSTGDLSFVTAPDYEAPTDVGADNVYDVTVQASDGSLSSTQAIAVTVTAVNDNTPVITSSATANVAENTTAVMTVTATDADLPPQTLTYSIVGGADAAKFQIDANTGALSFITAPDYENPTDAGTDNVYDVTVQASDGSLSSTKAIAVTVTPVNDNTPIITSSATANVAENTTTVMTVTATDADLPAQTLTYSIVGGADAAKFTINSSSGALSFVTAPDYEAPTDSGADNVYNVTVQASDGSLSSTKAIAVTVTPVNDNTPVITSSATANVAENTTTVMTVTATDADLPAQTLTYSIVGGADAAKFTINAGTGDLSFVTAPDYEAPTDSGADNIYDVTVQASDGSLSSTQAIAVTVTAVNDNTPVITSSATANVAENTTAVMTVTATDADLPAQTLTYSIVGGADAAKFTINSSSGALSFVTAPDYEAPTDVGADNVYNVTVQASDGSLSSTKAIAVTVTPVNDNTPVITSSATANVAENTTAVMTVTATDADLPAQTLTYSIVGGADAAKFTINSSSGALSFVTAPDYEAPTDAGADNIYDVTVQASDGSLSSTQAIAVTVTAVNDNTPVITSSATANVAENTTAVMTVTATDADMPAQTLTYSIVGGADAAKFTINSSSGALSFVTAPDYEAPTDSGADNVYNVTVQASDGSLSSTQAIAVTVTPVNDNTPVITSSATANVAENTTTVMTVTATDADLPPQTLTYSIVGGADAAKFQIDANTGALSFITAPDYEAPTDSGADNVYDVTVQASDGSLSSTKAIAVTVTAVNDNTPVITSSATANVAENTTTVMTVTATDADLPAQTLTYSIVGGADAAKFTINSSSGALSFVTAPDYENPTDAGTDNIYDVTVQASDGSLSSTQAIAVTVTAVNDNTPVITSSATANVAENTTAVMTVSATDTDLPAQTLTYSIVGGADAAKFTINSSTGALSFVTAPDYDAPTDSGADNLYNVTVQASDGSRTGSMALAITVTNRSEMPQGSDGRVTAAEDVSYVFDTADFGFADPLDVPENHLAAVQIVTAPALGSLTLDGMAVSNGQWISAADIAAGHLQFLAPENANGTAYATLAFRVQDDGGTVDGGVDTEAGTHTLTIDVAPVDDAPIVTRAAMQIFAGATTVVPTDAFDVADVDSDTTAIRLVVDTVSHGHFALLGATSEPVTNFSYGELAAGQVIFVQTDLGSLPTVVVHANDGVLDGPSRQADMAYLGGGALPANGSGGTADGSTGGNDSSPLVESVTAATDKPTTSDSSKSTSTSNPSAAANTGLGDAFRGAGTVEADQVQQVPSGFEAAEPQVRRPRAENNLVSFVGRTQITLTVGAGADGPLMEFLLSGQDARQAASAASARQAAVDRPKTPPLSDDAYADVRVVLNAVEMSGIALSVGAVWWATRAGGLIASLLMAAPAWRTFDPLPVLGRKDGDEADDWGDVMDDEMTKDEERAGDVFDDTETERAHA